MTKNCFACLPTPKTDDFLGHLTSFRGTDVHNKLLKWSTQLGQLYEIRLANKKAVVISDRSLIQQILKQRPDRYRRYKKIESVFKELGFNGIFSAESKTWLKQRNLLSPAFNSKNLRYFFPMMNKIADRLIEKIYQQSIQNNPIYIKSLYTQYTVDIISNIAFAYDLNTLCGKNKKLHEHLSAIFPGINYRVSLPLPIWRFIKTHKDRKLESAVLAVKSFLKERVEATKQKIASKPSLIEHPENLLQAMLAEQVKQNHQISDEEILANTVTILIAGEDTTANALSWLTFLLSNHTNIQGQLHKEISSLPENSFQCWPLPHTPFLTAAIHESMRCRPVAPLLYMQPLEDIELEETIIPKGTFLILLLNAMGNDEHCFTKANEFNPARWLDKNSCNISDMNPFGGGPRICPGRSLALLEIKIAMLRLFNRFEIEVVDAHKVKEHFHFAMMPENLLIRVKPLTK